MKRRTKIALWILLVPVILLVWLWTLGAIYYMVGGPRSTLGTVVPIVYGIGTILVLWLQRRCAHWWLLSAWAVALGWFFTLQPSNDRDWEISVGRTPKVEFEGEMVTIENIRSFRYRSTDDFDVAYSKKTYDLTKLESADLILCYWDGNTAIAHTMISFGFEGGDFICLSVETRRERGEAWGGLPGIYRQFEVLYILGDELDLLNLRTSYRGEEVYLYSFQVPRSDIRSYFELVLRHIDQLNREPEFYDTLDYNCSSALTRMSAELWPDRPRPTGLKSILNGGADREAYDRGRLSTDLPFEELRRRSHVTQVGYKYREDPEFSRKIREGLPR